MSVRASSWSIVLVLAVAAGAARADPSAEGTTSNEWEQAELALFDALRSDSSPRTQVLAARLYVADDGAASVLRPKRADVVARAANLVPDDPFVQWMAASTGNYYSSQCGPVRWPEAEVAKLTQLEPDNAGALLYDVALAQLKGDANAVDDALARMAAAKRADDHRGDEVEAWRKAILAHPEAATQAVAWVSDGRSPEDAALLGALFKTRSGSSTAGTAVESACKPDAGGDRAWRRLGWCVDAGLLLARKGNSLSLREEGLSLLAASGATPDDLADLRRDLAWLKANAATVLDNPSSYEDAPEDRTADWHDAPSEMGATDRRLARLGLPSTPPAGWMPSGEDGDESPEDAGSKQAWQTYLQSLLEDMRSSADVHEKAIALSSASEMGKWFNTGDSDSKKESEASADADHAALVALAAAHPDDALVQWITAALPAGAKRDGSATERLQRIDGGNAAVWALSLDPAAADVDGTLRRIAASQRFDDHYVDILGIWFAAVKRHPAPAEVLDALHEQMDPKRALSQDDIAASTTVMLATMGSVSAIGYDALDVACSSPQDSRRASCAAIGRLLFDGGHTLLTTMIGEMLLRKYDALDADDSVRARQLAWWRESSWRALGSDTDTASHYVDDTLSTKSEVEALRLAMARAGKAEPPADWKSPAEKREAKRPAK